MNYELLRLLVQLVKNQGRLKFYTRTSALGFCFRFLYQSIGSGQKLVAIKPSNGPRIFLRTKSSDLDVFIQQFTFGELLDPKIIAVDPKNILDAGANIGLATLVFHRLFPKAKILAVEPDPGNISILKKNCEHLVSKGILQIIDKAFLPKDEENISLVTREGLEYATKITRDNGSISAIGINALSNDFAFNPELVKMDIEGSELDFLNEGDLFYSWLVGKWLLIELHGPEVHIEFFSWLKTHPHKNLSRSGEYWISKIIN